MKITKSFIISYYEYTDKDSFNLRKILEYLLKLLDNQSEIILVEQGFESCVTWLDQLPHGNKIKYIFLQSYRIFNKGWGYNVGVKNASGEQIILHDTDTYLRPKTYSAVWMLNKFDMVKPYKNIVKLDESDSKKYLTNYNFNIILGKRIQKYIDISGGVLMINKKKYLRIKGFDETIVSYNYQKVAFDIKVKKLGLTVNHYNDSCLAVEKDNIFLSKDIFQNDKYICYLYNDIETMLLEEMLTYLDFGLKELSRFDYDSFMLTDPVSIIITAYQTQNYIEECLDSIENQTYFIGNDYYEILLGIDACEETLKKVMEIRDKYRNLKVFMMEENRGTYITSNTLIENANYQNIIRFDSDDIMYPEMVQKLLYYNKRYNVVTCRFYNMEIKRGERKLKLNKMSHANGVHLMKKSLFKKLGGYQPWMCGADSELFVRGKDVMKVKIIKDPLFERRVHDNNLTRRSDTGVKSKMREEYKKLIGKHKDIKIKSVTNKFKVV